MLNTHTALNERYKKGFTLIELLVVIAIIAILAAILFPVFARARENARRASCMSNMKQIGLGIMQYTQDYDEKYPYNQTGGVLDYATTTTPNWIAQVQPYIKSWQLFACPSGLAATSAQTGNTTYYPSGNNWSNYIANAMVIVPAALPVRSLASIPNSSGIVMISEWQYAYALAYQIPLLNSGATNPRSYNEWNYASINNVHFGGGNQLFADGHVKWKLQQAVCSADYGLLSSSGTNLCGPQAAATLAYNTF